MEFATTLGPIGVGVFDWGTATGVVKVCVGVERHKQSSVVGAVVYSQLVVAVAAGKVRPHNPDLQQHNWVVLLAAVVVELAECLPCPGIPSLGIAPLELGTLMETFCENKEKNPCKAALWQNVTDGHY